MNRRGFLRNAIVGTGGITMSTAPLWASLRPARGAIRTPAENGAVGLVKGASRQDNMYHALELVGDEIKQSIGNRQVIIKPNMISFTEEFPSTYTDHLRAILGFLKPFYRKQVIIAESSPRGASMEGFRNLGYLRLEKDYNIKWLDMNKAQSYPVYILDKNRHPMKILIPQILTDPNTYLISAARMKVHNTVIVTLANKNITMGAPQIIGDQHYKRNMHQGTKEINYNLFLMTQKIPIHLATIDGYEGMEHKGPRGGDPVNSRIAIASTDFLAADRVAIECMGIDFADIGYLNHCAMAGMGQADLNKLTIRGERISNCQKTYRLPENIQEQLTWKA